MRRRQAGVTLIEVGMALAIIAIALTPTISTWLSAAKSNQMLMTKAAAINVAQNVLQRQIENVPFATQQASSGTDQSSGDSFSLTLTTVDSTCHKAQVTVTPPGFANPMVNLVVLVASPSS
ncbi:MAG: type II secretion system GspH family protein [Cyanobacteria bacterium REEB65]|nr:type II secretion system GspH family protein [Cyanobacteria bacterium REEB65]